MKLFTFLLVLQGFTAVSLPTSFVKDAQGTHWTFYQNDTLAEVTKDFLLGKFKYRKDARFTKVDTAYCAKEIYLQKEVYLAYQKMHAHALKDSIDLQLLSGTRSFYEQKWIWERKWERYKELPPRERALKILEFSSMPSTSRHHWGTDLDLVHLSPQFFETTKGKKVYDWLQQHAKTFGFYQVYTSQKEGRTGYQEEKWHWTYLPLSKEYLEQYHQQIKYTDFTGFLGAHLAKELNVIQAYVNGLNSAILNKH